MPPRRRRPLDTRLPGYAWNIERLNNPITGEHITLLESGDEPLRLELELRPLGAPGGFVHRHAVAERFEVRSGDLLAFQQGWGWRRIGPGDVVDVPSGVWHMVLALKRSTAHVVVSPPRHFADVLRCSCAVATGDVRPATLRRLNDALREHDCVPRLAP